MSERLCTGVSMAIEGKRLLIWIVSIQSDTDGNPKIINSDMTDSAEHATWLLRQINSTVVWTFKSMLAEPFYMNLMMWGVPIRLFHATKASRKTLVEAFYEDTSRNMVMGVFDDRLRLYQYARELHGNLIGAFQSEGNVAKCEAFALAWYGWSTKTAIRVDFA